MSSPLIVDYYSDVLCVWAWIAQRRIDELNRHLGSKIDIRYHYMDVFGDAVTKIPTQWHDRGGYKGFAKHVTESAEDYNYALTSKEIWLETKPTTSANPHLVLKAIELSYSPQHSIDFAGLFRQAFFVEAQDISNIDVLLTIIEYAGLDRDRVNESIINGSAMAALMGDYQQAKTLGLKGSPTYIINDGRQVLYGNVGYRVLLANIEELLKTPSKESSWC
jgi:predicted DsbA family dithiol-disulfide isomerase